MIIIKFCSIDSKEETEFYLQCCGNSTNALSFYTHNGFYISKNNKMTVPKLVRPNGLFCINEDQISLMIWKHGCFNLQQKSSKSIDKDDDIEYIFHNDISITIDLSTNEVHQEINLKEEKRITLINKIKKTDKSFNADKYLKATDYDYIKNCYPP